MEVTAATDKSWRRAECYAGNFSKPEPPAETASQAIIAMLENTAFIVRSPSEGHVLVTQ